MFHADRCKRYAIVYNFQAAVRSNSSHDISRLGKSSDIGGGALRRLGQARLLIF
jgi:hypothetical protein